MTLRLSNKELLVVARRWWAIGDAMYRIATYPDEFAPAEATDEMMSIGHDVDLSHQGLFNRDSLEAELLEFLKRWADPRLTE